LTLMSPGTANATLLTGIRTAATAARALGSGKTAAAVAPIPTPPRVPDPTDSSGEPDRIAQPGLPGTGPSVGVPVPSGWNSTVQQVQSGVLLRDYVVVRPTAADPGPLPVLIVLHGHGMTPAGVARVSAFLPIVGRAVMVYPAGFGQSWNAGGCCGLARAAGVDDVAFLSTVVHDVLASVPGTSAQSVYLAGFSNGGRMAYRMACADPALFAGVAAVEAVPVPACTPPRPVSITIVAYQDDPYVSVSAQQPTQVVHGMDEPRVDAVVAEWRAADRCVGTPTVKQVGTALISLSANCQNQTRVQYALYAGGSHRWPQGDPGTPSASRLIWSFLH
ncbi:MAG: alpha/beta hydrolase family esterase, partial [Acidimicrobiales bacterium]